MTSYGVCHCAETGCHRQWVKYPKRQSLGVLWHLRVFEFYTLLTLKDFHRAAHTRVCATTRAPGLKGFLTSCVNSDLTS